MHMNGFPDEGDRYSVPKRGPGPVQDLILKGGVQYPDSPTRRSNVLTQKSRSVRVNQTTPIYAPKHNTSRIHLVC